MSNDLTNTRFWRTAVAIFGLMVLINYLPLFSGRVPFPRDLVLRHSAWNGQPREQLPELIDVVALFYPFRAMLSRAADEWTLPLWNPYIMSGAPFQANAQSALFAPSSILYYVLPLKAAWTASAVLRLFLAAVFMTLFVRAIGGSPTGSLVAGILFALCGYTIQWHGFSNGESSIWLPLMCYAVHRLHVKPGAWSIAVAAMVFPLALLAGHPETAAHSTVAAVAMAAFLWIFPHRSGAPRVEPRFALHFVLAGTLALGLASVQLVPTLEWLGELKLQVETPEPGLDRHQGQGFFSRDITRHPSSAGLRIPEAAAYIGMLGLLAASLAIFHQSRRYVYFFAGVAIAAAAVAFDVQPVRWMIDHIPIVKAMKNGRMTLLVDFALIAMAGLGISAIGEQIQEITARRRRRAMAFMLVAFVTASVGVYEVHRATWVPVDLWRAPFGSMIFLGGAFAVLALRIRGNLNDRIFPVLVCGLAGLEMLSFSYGYGGFAAAQEVFPPAPVFDFIRARDQSTPFRVAKDRVPIPHDAGIIYGFEAADGYDLTTERTRLFNGDFMENRGDGVMLLAEPILAARDRRFDMLNVKYLMVTQPGSQFEMLSAASDRFTPVFSQGSVALFENATALPRFFFAPLAGIEVIPDMTAQLERLKESSFDPQQSVIFSSPPPEFRATSARPAPVEARAHLANRRINEYSLRVESSQSAVLVLSQMYYPGWKATVDGTPVSVYPVNLALTGIIVPAGSHEIRLFFQPRTFRIGLVISLLSAFAVGLLIYLSTGRRGSKRI